MKLFKTNDVGLVHLCFIFMPTELLQQLSIQFMDKIK